MDAVSDPQRRADCKSVVRLMQQVTGEKPRLWGTSIVGFGSYRYVYDSGREGDAPLAGFSPRAQAPTLYVMAGFADAETLLAKRGKFKTGKACLYLKSLADVDQAVLAELITRSVEHLRKTHRAAA
ncbi:MAG: DUF1801 domain-containing protein [Betaproteobacteria bacterium]